MKNVILIFLFIIPFCSFAQRDFSYFKKFDYNIQNLIAVEDGFVVLRKIGIRSNDIFNPIEALRIDTLGNIKWKMTLPGIFSQSEVQGIFNISREGNLIHIFGSHSDCDVGGFSYPVQFCSINMADGSMIEYGSNKLNSKSDTTEVGAIAKMANKYFSIFEPNSYKIGTYIGDTLKLTENVATYPLSFCFNHNLNQVLTYKEIDNSFGNDILLQLWDSNLNLVSRKIMKTKSCKYLGALGKGFYGFFNDGGNGNTFFVFDSLLNEISNTAFLNINFYSDNLIVNENRFFTIKNKYPSEIQQMINFNAGLVSETYKTKWSNILDIKELNGSTYVLGLTAYNQLFIEKLQNSQSINSGIKTGVNLEISNLMGDFNISVQPGIPPIFPISYITDFQNITARVTNLGSQKIHGIEIKSKIFQNYFCPKPLELKYQYNDITLNPGDSIYVDIPPLFINYVSDISKMCYSVSTLDLKNDENIEDNIICVSVKNTATNELSIKEKITLNPNPTDNQLNITSDFEIDQLAIFDIAGRKIITKEVHGFQYQLDCSSMPVGYYFLHIKGEGKETYQRFIVQR